MYDLNELSTQQKVELELMLKKCCDATEARREAGKLLSESESSDNTKETSKEKQGFLAFNRENEDDSVYVKVSSISSICKSGKYTAITADGVTYYTLINLPTFINALKKEYKFPEIAFASEY